MRRLILLSPVLLLSAAWTMAQYDSSPGNESSTTAYKVTVEGCLEGAIGSYTLTDARGVAYQLAGNTNQFDAHVGETIRVTGDLAPVTHVPGAMSEGTGPTQPTISVNSLKQVSTVCHDSYYY